MTDESSREEEIKARCKSVVEQIKAKEIQAATLNFELHALYLTLPGKREYGAFISSGCPGCHNTGVVEGSHNPQRVCPQCLGKDRKQWQAILGLEQFREALQGLRYP